MGDVSAAIFQPVTDCRIGRVRVGRMACRGCVPRARFWDTGRTFRRRWGRRLDGAVELTGDQPENNRRDDGGAGRNQRTLDPVDIIPRDVFERVGEWVPEGAAQQVAADESTRTRRPSCASI
eukprot:5907527-Prymnesium_polylepis.1